MTANGWLQIAIFFALILVCVKPLGSFIATVIEGRRNFLTPVLELLAPETAQRVGLHLRFRLSRGPGVLRP